MSAVRCLLGILAHMTAKQRYCWDAVVVAFVFWPIYAVALSPYFLGVLSCLFSSLVLIFSGVVLVFRHRTFLGLIPIVFAVIFFLMFLSIPQTYH